MTARECSKLEYQYNSSPAKTMSIPGEWKSKAPFSMAIESMELMQGRFTQHYLMGTARIK